VLKFGAFFTNIATIKKMVFGLHLTNRQAKTSFKQRYRAF